MAKMKCYIVEDPNAYEFGVTTVFAETAAKAKYAAYGKDEMGTPDSRNEFIYYSATRLPEGDSHWKEGKYELDWDDLDDRILLCKNGWSCGEDYYEEEECLKCGAKEYCSLWERLSESIE